MLLSEDLWRANVPYKEWEGENKHVPYLGQSWWGRHIWKLQSVTPSGQWYQVDDAMFWGVLWAHMQFQSGQIQVHKSFSTTRWDHRYILQLHPEISQTVWVLWHNERLIDAIIFGTSCIKAQDKLLQTPKTLSLQQCLMVCRHYESLNLHIQQIRPDKHVEYLKKHHQKSKQKAKPQHRSRFKSQGRKPNQRDDTQFQFQSKQSHYKCRGCGKAPRKNRRKQCTVWEIFAKSVADITTMSQCVAKYQYQSSPKNMNTCLWMN